MMRKVQHNVLRNDTKNAEAKAKNDVMKLLLQLGYENMSSLRNSRYLRYLQQYADLLLLNRNTCLFMQYPSTRPQFYAFARHFRKYKQIALVHDLQSLRGRGRIADEVRILNAFDIIISLNEAMTDYLIEHGLTVPVLNMGLWCYLLDRPVSVNREYEMDTVMFAGNLQKSGFVKELWKVEGLRFKLFGAAVPELSAICRSENIEYMGAYPPEELLRHVQGGWSLVWDGTSVDTCAGRLGEYQKYISPHKTSMSILAERPIIMWSRAALAEYIVDHHLGITVDSLHDIREKIAGISQADYQMMLQSVRAEKQRLMTGENLKDLIMEAEKRIGVF